MSRNFKKVVAIFLIYAIINIAPLLGAEEKVFIYRDAERRDPFVPLVTKEGKLRIGYGVITSIDEVVVEGVVYDPAGGSIVIINDIILKENDQIGKIKVKKIDRDKVILYFAGKDYTFKIKE